ncbi:MAG: hypothetical protein RMI89_00850 [Gloeomargarita sp. SKYBB_i_bin120]|nr:hypothetical protein [Gloeomargarita sp. SKYG98]MCS7291509.1 hypothetical protein [Gloeomargarita sp. SKYB120]MDW8177069.1 hypothetical protein [Gloeomargarita sp. SKYBB_i_bin120]
MPRAKLTPADRSQIAQRFRDTAATATSLAAEYDVSISTIIRILKEELTEAVYDALVPQKRAGRWHESPPPPTATPKILAYKPVTEPVAETPEPATPPEPPEPPVLVPPPEPSAPALDTEPTAVLPEWDADAQDDWDEEEGDALEEEETAAPDFDAASVGQQILPLEPSVLPATCYLVVDRAAELVVRPLNDFSRWGGLPTVNATAPTLPVFNNHRVAKRFSGRHHRVLKVPDGQLIYKTSRYLYDKGITHLLVNGQVYTVTPNRS